MRIIFAIGGFIVGGVIAAGTIALATELAQGRTFRDVVQRPVIRTWAATYVAACGIVGALITSRL